MASLRKLTEHQFQVQLCELLRKTARPTVYWFAIGNGGKRPLSVGKRMKEEGVKAGVADMGFMLEKGKMAWLELKVKGGSLSPEQQEFRLICNALNHPHGVARDMQEAFEFLRDVGVLREGVELC